MSAPLSLILPLVALLLVLAVASAVMARGGFTGSLRRAGRLGVHSPAAMASDEAFATANKVAAPVAAGAAVIAAVIAVLLLVLSPSTATTLVMAVIGLVGSGALLLAAGVLGDRAARFVPIRRVRRPHPDRPRAGGRASLTGAARSRLRYPPLPAPSAAPAGSPNPG